jgi:hypothetical protein
MTSFTTPEARPDEFDTAGSDVVDADARLGSRRIPERDVDSVVGVHLIAYQLVL